MDTNDKLVTDEVVVPAEVKPEPTPEVKPKAKVAKKGVTTVRNNYTSDIEVAGVTIPKGEAKEVPGFNEKNGVMKVWLAENVISVE